MSTPLPRRRRHLDFFQSGITRGTPETVCLSICLSIYLSSTYLSYRYTRAATRRGEAVWASCVMKDTELEKL